MDRRGAETGLVIKKWEVEWTKLKQALKALEAEIEVLRQKKSERSTLLWPCRHTRVVCVFAGRHSTAVAAVCMNLVSQTCCWRESGGGRRMTPTACQTSDISVRERVAAREVLDDKVACLRIEHS